MSRFERPSPQAEIGFIRGWLCFVALT